MINKTFTLLALVLITGSAQQIFGQSIYLSVTDSANCQSGGAFNIRAYSNNPPFTYLWSDGSTADNIYTGIVGQSYSVTVTDASGATETAPSVVCRIASYTPMAVTNNIIQDVCAANTLGGIVDLTVTDGLMPYRFRWGSGETTEDVSGLFTNTGVYVSDAMGCQTYENITFANNGIYIYDVQQNDANCTMSNGSIVLSVNQNTYNFEWSDGQTTSLATGLAPGAYGLTVSDPANNCVVRRVFQVDNTLNCASLISGYVYNNVACLPLQNAFSSYQQVVITDLNTGTSYYPYTNQNGYYSFRTIDATSYAISVTVYGTATVNCPNTNNISVMTTAQGGNFTNNDFFVGRINNNDLRISYYGGVVRPFGTQWNSVIICNEGNATQSGDVVVDLDPILSYLNGSSYLYSYNYSSLFGGYNYALPNPTISGSTLTYPYANLLTGECRNFSFNAFLNSNQPIGTTFTNYASVTPLAGDAVPADNADTSINRVVNSYDPNDKQQFNLRSGSSYNANIYTQDTEMEYLIRFQNTGNAPAIRVEIRDTFDVSLVASSVRNVSASHNANVRIENNVLIATFDNIYLADSFSNEAESHGFISFKVNRQAGLPLMSEITNSAAIYFDFNEPIITNTQITTIIQQVVSAEKIANEINLNVMPNPANELITVQYTLAADADVTINVINSVGQVAQNVCNNQNTVAGSQMNTINVNQLPAGIYYIFIQTNKGNYAQKFIKD
jgi:Secretion system C-terminal sorting domain